MRREDVRVARLLRRLDLEEVLEEGLGLEVVRRNGGDVYTACPDPGHVDTNPSFHVSVDPGGGRLGWFNCWSHPEDGGLRGRNFIDLVAKVRFGVWGEGGAAAWPSAAQRAAAVAWLRAEFLSGDVAPARERSLRRRVAESRPTGELIWPPARPVAESRPEFGAYLARRGIPPARAAELGVLAVVSAGDRLRGVLRRTLPAVLFPIRVDGAAVNWFARGIYRLPSADKGRYCPGLPLGKGAGVLWAPDGVPPGAPVVLVEGVFDAERVRAIAAEVQSRHVVVAVLGGRLYPAQAARLRVAASVLHLADGDRGGRVLSDSVRVALRGGPPVRVCALPEGTDPGDAPVGVLHAALLGEGSEVRTVPAPSQGRVRLRIRRARR